MKQENKIKDMHDVFISYSSKDQTMANTVVNILEGHRVKCWIAYRDAVPGDDYAASIVRAIKGSKICVLIISDKSILSKHVLSEVNSCVNNGITIIPFRISDVVVGDALEYYLGRTHWLDAITAPVEEHINKLAEQIKTLLGLDTKLEGTSEVRAGTNSGVISAGVGNMAGASNVGVSPAPQRASTPGGGPHSMDSSTRMTRYEDLIALGYNAHTIAIQLVENDYMNSNEIGNDNEGTAQQWADFVQNCTETFQYLLNGENRIVGDWSILALNPQMFGQAKAGKLLEKDVTFETSEMIVFPGDYYGYLLAICLTPDYRTMDNYMKLINSFFAQLERYAENGIFFREWVMNVFTIDIESLIKRLGFKFLVNNISVGKIYHLDFMPLPQNALLDRFPRLKELYAAHAALENN